MQEASHRRFHLGDAMLMVAAVTPSLLLIRIGVELGRFDVNKRSLLTREFVEFLNVGGGCILAGLVPAVLVVGLYRAHPSRRDAAQGPGLVACIVALAASILPVLWFAGRVLAESRLRYPIFAVPFNNAAERWMMTAFGRWMMVAGPMIVGAWIALALNGRWRPRPTWTDRAGYVLGACFVLIYLYGEIYFVVTMPINRWWNG